MIDKETRRLASIFDALEASVYIIDKDYTIEYMNRTAIQIFGEGVGKKCHQMIACSGQICPWCRAKEVFDGEILRWEHTFHHLNKTFEIYELPLERPDDSLSHMCIYRDITAAKEREKRLTASIADYRRLFERVKWGVFITSREGKFLDANEALLDMLHYKSKEAFCRIDIEKDLYVNPRDRRRFLKTVQRDGQVIDYETEFKRQDGSVISVLLTGHPHIDENHHVTGYQGIIIDQSHRKEMERRLRSAHNLQKNLIQSSLDAIVAADRGGNIIIFNEAAERIYGYTQAEALSEIHVARLYSEGEAGKIKNLIYGPEYGGPGRLINYTSHVLTKHGQRVPILLSAALLREEGKEVGTVGFFKDMRDVRRLENELIKRMEFEHNLIQGSIDAITASDKNGTIVIFNNRAEKLLGYTAVEVVGKLDFNDLFPDGATVEEISHALLSSENGEKNGLLLYETNLMSKSGAKIPVQLSATVIFNRGVEIGRVAFFRDLREIRKMERQFADQARVLHEHKMISLGRLSASVVHELNNPLTGILNYLRLMIKMVNRGTLDRQQLEKFQKYLTFTESEADRCSQIVSGLLAFSRKSKLQFSEVNVTELLEKCIMLSQHNLMLQNIEIKTDLEMDIPSVWGDFNQIQQCVINLIFNAIDAMPNGGELTIGSTFDSTRGMVEIRVTDIGCGIAEEDLNQIFEPFYSTKKEGKGLGLGLSMAYGIINTHKGTINVQSRPGQGSVFTIALPAVEKNA